MSSDIDPVGRTRATDTVTADTIPASLPPEVHEAIGVAATAYENLKANGTEMRFRIDGATGELTAEVHDARGHVLFTVPASTVLDVASGEPLSQRRDQAPPDS